MVSLMTDAFFSELFLRHVAFFQFVFKQLPGMCCPKRNKCFIIHTSKIKPFFDYSQICE